MAERQERPLDRSLNMGGLVIPALVAGGTAAAVSASSKPKSVKPPPLPPPTPVPEPELYEEAGELEKKKVSRRKGRAKTIITGELEPETRGKTLLG
jgi:hypothetical protein